MRWSIYAKKLFGRYAKMKHFFSPQAKGGLVLRWVWHRNKDGYRGIHLIPRLKYSDMLNICDVVGLVFTYMAGSMVVFGCLGFPILQST